MDFVARAKALLEKQARTAALVVVPLAAAVAAQAGPILPTGNFGCTNVQIGSCGGAGDAQLAVGGNGLAGLQFFTSGGLTIISPSGSTGQLLMQASGNMNEAFSGTIPLGYTFSLSGSGITTWSLSYNLSQTSGGTYAALVSGSGSGSFSGTTQFTGVNLLAGLSTNSNFLMTVNCPTCPGSVSVNIPSSSIDFNSTAAVPEPAPAALLGLGIALLGGWKLVRRRNRFVVVPPGAEPKS